MPREKTLNDKKTTNRNPENLRQIVGAVVFASDRPVSIQELRNVLRETPADGETEEGAPSPYAGVQPATLRAVLHELRDALDHLSAGIELVEVAGGFRMQTRAVCSPWVRKFLGRARPGRLSQPALETLAVIAYRQPIPRADIESIRGVAAGHVLKNLVELRLIRIVGRGDLPGKPFLYGTTTAFLEYFGLESLKDLDELDPSLRTVRKSLKRKSEADGAEKDEAVAADAPAGEDGG